MSVKKRYKSDKERWQYRRNKTKAEAELIRRMGGGGGTGPLTDWSITPDKPTKLNNYPPFASMTEEQKKALEKIAKEIKQK